MNDPAVRDFCGQRTFLDEHLEACLPGREGCKLIEAIDLEATGITGECLPLLVKKVPKLKWLFLSRTPINNGCLAALARLTHLEVLDLGGTPLDDEGFAALPHLRALQALYLRGTKLTDGSAGHFQGFRLHELELTGTNVGDAVLEQLGHMHTLTDLELRGTKITDTGLQSLNPLSKHLQYLGVSNTSITLTYPNLRSLRYRRRHRTKVRIYPFSADYPACHTYA